MSVINKMLQELERRQSGTVSQGHMGGAVRISAAAAPTRIWRRMVIGSLLIAMGAAVAYGTVWMKKQAPAGGPAVLAAAAPVVPHAPANPVAAVTAPTVASASAAPQAAQPFALPAPVATAPRGQHLQRKQSVPAKAKPSHEGAVKASASPTAPAAVAPAPPAKKSMNAASHVDDTASAKTISPRQEAEYRYQKALPLIQAGRIAEAQETLQGALASDPSHGPARQLLAGVLIDGKHGKEAEALLRSGLEKSPQQIAQAMMLAHLQVDGGDLPGALATLRQSLPYADNNSSYHAFFAALLQRNGQHQEAVDQYTVALSKPPVSAPWLVGLGISLQAQKRMAEAHEAFKRAKQSGALGSDLSTFVDQRMKQIQAQRVEGN